MAFRIRLSAARLGCTLVVFLLLIFPSPLVAQERPGIDPTLRSGDRQAPLLKDDEDVLPAPTITPPEIPDEDIGSGEQSQLGPRIKVWAKQIRTIGNKTFSDAQLAPITKPFLNQQLDYQDLEQIRRNLTLHYIQNGYINSGAVLPDQTVTDGVVTFVIVEGELTEVNISGNRWLRDWYYRSRVQLASGPPVNITNLEQRLQLLQQEDMIRRVQAELKPGMAPGKSVLALQVAERLPVDVWVAFNNYQSPSVGAERGLIALAHRSLTGLGDRLSFTYGRSRGLDPLVDVAYQIPFTPWDTELGLRYRKNDFDIVEEQFKDLDIESESEIYEVRLRQPVWHTTSHELAIGLIGERLHSQSWIMGTPYSFSAGTEDGESTVAALRFFQEYLYRTRQNVVAVNSRFSWGLDTLDATQHDNEEPDGQFFAWLGQFQWAGIIDPLDIQTILRTDAQFSNEPLLALEQIPVGGRYSVRGYLENQLVRDNGVVASLEIRIPLIQNTVWADYLQVAPFFDYGQAWYEEASTPDPRTIFSVGVGLRWALTMMTDPFPISTALEVYWGHQLEDVENDGDTLQHDGFHFQLAVSGF
ncbi:putative surface antigen (D15) [Desulfosarcina variabilis str. Montpellier]|uniref:ShlB/FhaC/HecB family hemolysin secretion/activation protein n=1 Tax=Desulfosarcina variabilis TaxID=2300 RepID=UPI003AFAE77E